MAEVDRSRLGRDDLAGAVPDNLAKGNVRSGDSQPQEGSGEAIESKHVTSHWKSEMTFWSSIQSDRVSLR